MALRSLATQPLHNSCREVAILPRGSSWFDPTNPVVPMSGRLRADLVERLRETTRTTDLVIAMGTSLSGVMADSLVSSVGHRAAEEREAHPAKDRRLKPVGKDRAGGPDSISMPPSAGVVIINVQQTRLDQLSTLRIFAKLDDVLKLLSKELELSPAAPWPMKTSAQDTAYRHVGQPSLR